MSESCVRLIPTLLRMSATVSNSVTVIHLHTGRTGNFGLQSCGSSDLSVDVSCVCAGGVERRRQGGAVGGWRGRQEGDIGTRLETAQIGVGDPVLEYRPWRRASPDAKCSADGSSALVLPHLFGVSGEVVTDVGAHVGLLYCSAS
eukprot:2423078-Prymnesium_polylepis.1